MTQARKVSEDRLGAERPALEAAGWRYAGPMVDRPHIHRFVRESSESPDDVTLTPNDTYVKVRHRMIS